MKGLRSTLPAIIVFVVFVICILVFQKNLKDIGIDPLVLRMGNILLYILTAFSIIFQYRALCHPNPNVFIRSVMASTIIKMVVIALGVVIYAKATGDAFSGRSVMGILLMYLVYLGTEVYIVMKLNRKKNA